MYLHLGRFTLGVMMMTMYLCPHHVHFVPIILVLCKKTFLVSVFFFPSFHNPTYTHNGVLFSIAPQSYVHLALSCLCIFTFHHAPSTSLGCFFYRLYMFTSLCFSLLCSFLFVHGDHHPLVEGLSPFKGSSFLSLYFIVATFSSLFVCALWFCLASCKWSSFTISIKG